jgi:hypothetical protein
MTILLTKIGFSIVSSGNIGLKKERTHQKVIRPLFFILNK